MNVRLSGGFTRYLENDLAPFTQLIDVNSMIKAGTTGHGREGQVVLMNLQRDLQGRQFLSIARKTGLSLEQVYGVNAFRGWDQLGATSQRTGVVLSGDESLRAAAGGARDVLDEIAARRRDHVAIVTGHTNMNLHAPLIDELQRRGVAHPSVYMIDDLTMDDGVLRHMGTPVPTPEAVIPRMKGRADLTVLRQLESDGVHVLNGGQARRSSSKVRSAELLQKHDIPTPTTIILRGEGRDIAQWRAAAEELHYPVIIKGEFGAGGAQVHKADTPEQLDALYERLSPSGGNFLAQEAIPPVPGKRPGDLRAYMVVDVHGEPQLTSAYHRWAGKDDFRAVSNGFTQDRIAVTDTLLDPHYDPGNGRLLNADAPRATRHDTFTDHELEMLRETTRASGGSALGVDLMQLPEPRMWRGEPVRYAVIELNTAGAIPEIDLTLPYREHALPRIADLAAYGAG